MLNPIITNNLLQIKALCQTHKVKELYVFGSVTTDKFNENSDLDFLYTMKEDIPEMEYANNFFDLLWAFEGLFNRKVDMVAEKYLRNRIFIAEVNNTKLTIYKA